jgi:hypothetical protein
MEDNHESSAQTNDMSAGKNLPDGLRIGAIDLCVTMSGNGNVFTAESTQMEKRQPDPTE